MMQFSFCAFLNSNIADNQLNLLAQRIWNICKNKISPVTCHSGSQIMIDIIEVSVKTTPIENTYRLQRSSSAPPLGHVCGSKI